MKNIFIFYLSMICYLWQICTDRNEYMDLLIEAGDITSK